MDRAAVYQFFLGKFIRDIQMVGSQELFDLLSLLLRLARSALWASRVFSGGYD